MPEKQVYKERNFQILCGVTLMAVLGVSSVTPAFPQIVEELHINETDVGILITVFSFPGIVLAPIVGFLGDRFGRRRLMVPALFLFALAGGACALTADFNTLVALRALQGIGAAPLGPLSLTIIGDLFSGRRRVAAMGLNASVLSIGTASYPLIGGALATLAWNYPFLLPLLAIPVGFLVLCCLRNPEPRSSYSLRGYLGGVWVNLKNIRVVGAFTAGVVLFVILFGAFLTYFSLFLGTSFHAPSYIIGLVFSSMSLVTAMVSSQLGRIVKIASETTLIKFSFVFFALALGLFPFMPHMGLMLIPVFILGVGQGIGLPGLMTYVASLAIPEYRATFMAVNSTMLRAGQTAGPLVFGLAYMYADFQGVFLFGAGLALATAIIGFIGGRMVH